jgi:hypothetical protein
VSKTFVTCSALSALTLCALALLTLSGCLSPGEIDDPEAFLARIGHGEGGVSNDGSVGHGDSGAGNASMTNPCDAVVTDLLKTCQASVCHGNDSSSPLNLEMTGLPGRLVDKKASTTCKELPYIDSQAPEDSLILGKLTTKPPCGSPMPLGGKTPTAMQQSCMLEWVMGAVGGDSSPTKPSTMDAGTKTDAGMDAGADCKTRDTDKDGTNDCDDMCVSDKDKTEPGECGCGKPEMPDCSSTDVPGLLVGSLDGTPNTDANPGNMGVDPLGMSISEKTDGALNTTWVFTGKIQITASGVASFYENYDDRVKLVIDGTTVLDDGTWNTPTTGTIMRAAGWYDFELRLGNGTGASGPSSGMGLGIGYSAMDRGGSTDVADYAHPANSSATKGDLFLTKKP